MMKYILSLTIITMMVSCKSSISEMENAEVKITPEFIQSVREFDDFNAFSEGMAVVKKDGKYGYINVDGELVVPCKYHTAADFSGGLGLVSCLDNNIQRYGYVNFEGNEIIPCKYAIAHSFSEGLALVLRDKGHGYINSDGVEVIPCQYSDGADFHCGLASVTNEEFVDEPIKFFFIDKNGSVALDNNYYTPVCMPAWLPPTCVMPEFKDSICTVFNENMQDYYIDTKGEIVEEPPFTDKQKEHVEFYEPINSYDVEPQNFVGLKDSLDNIIVPAKYTNIYSFNNGVALAELCNYHDLRIYGYVDKKGNSTFSDDDYKRFYAERKQISDKKEQERREEEERVRIEEEKRHHPENLFNELLSTTAWHAYYIDSRREKYEKVLTLRPTSEYTGLATTVTWIGVNRDRYYYSRDFTCDNCNYTIRGNILDVEWGNREFSLQFIIEYSDGEIVLRNTNLNRHSHIMFKPTPKVRGLVPEKYKMR